MTERTCSIPDCGAPHIARGWCARHYKRWQTAGHPIEGTRDDGPKGDIEARFWRKVEKTETCWLWTAALSEDGYGRFNPNNGTNERYAHRVSWALSGRALDPELELDHVVCNVRKCVRPDHLEQVTHAVNIARATARNANPTHCRNGHELTADNVKPGLPGSACYTCYLIGQRKYKAKIRASKRR